MGQLNKNNKELNSQNMLLQDKLTFDERPELISIKENELEQENQRLCEEILSLKNQLKTLTLKDNVYSSERTHKNLKEESDQNIEVERENQIVKESVDFEELQAHLSNTNKELERENKLLCQNLFELKDELDNLKKEYSELLKNNNGSIDKKSKTKGAVNENSEKVTKLEKLVSILENQIIELRNAMDSKEDQINSKRAVIDNLEAKLDKKRKKINE